MLKLRNPALAVSLVALFASLGGGAVAASLITGKQIKDGSLTGRDIRDRSLLAKDFKAGQIPRGPRGIAGPAGVAGVAGAAGAAGVAGPAGAAGAVGAVGAAGPTASAFAQNETGATLGLGANKVLQTSIAVTVASRLVAHASIDVGSSGTATSLSCYVTDDAAAAPANDWGIRTNEAVPVDVLVMNTNAMGSKVVQPGTTTVIVFCEKPLLGSVSFVEGDLSVIAIAT